MKKIKIFENFGLKLAAVGVSIVLWLVSVNVSDPVISNTYSDVPIQVINQDDILGKGEVYELSGDNTISVVVSAKRSVMDSLGKDNFKGVVDLSSCKKGKSQLPIKVESNKYANMIESMKSKTETVSVSVEEMLQKQFLITPVVSGKPEDGYVIGDVSTAENIVRISGAKSVVSQIRKVTAEVSVAGLSSSVNTSVDLKLYDENGDLIPDKNLSKNISTVAISVQILATKEVPLNITTFSGEFAQGYGISGDLSTNVESVMLAGKPSVLASVNSFELPAAAVNVNNLDETTDLEVNISKYLPDGISLADDSDALIKVTVPVEKLFIKSFEVDTKDIKIVNIPEGFEAEYAGSAEKIYFTLSGLEDEIRNLTPDQLNVKTDFEVYLVQEAVKEVTEGTYTVPITVSAQGCKYLTLDREHYIKLKLTEIDESKETENEE